MPIKFVILTSFFAFAAAFLQAQDTMILRNKEALKVKIVELGVSEIKYKLAPYALDTPIRSIEKYKVEKVIMENGEELMFGGNPLLDADMVMDQRSKAIKINFLSPLNSTLFFSYEQATKSGQSFEIEAGIIGAGFDADGSRPRGFATRLGYKFMRTPDYYNPGMRRTHILKGGYIKPEFIFSTYNQDSYFYDYSTNSSGTEREDVTGGAVILNIGKQWVFGERVLLDIFFGLGYGFTSDDDAMRYGFVGGDSDVPIAGSSGVRIGYLLK